MTKDHVGSLAAGQAPDDVAEDRGTKRRWITPVGWVFGLLLLGVLVIPVALSRVLTDRLTVHNRTTTPVSFTIDSFGGYGNSIDACSSAEFSWKQDGNRSGWTRADGGNSHGGGVEMAIPVERPFEAGPAVHFVVLVTADGVSEIEPASSLPACAGSAEEGSLGP